VKLSRSGQLIWQFGGTNPKDQSKFFTGVPTWSVNHGHQLLPDGTFIFFNNGANEAWGYTLNTTNMTASKILSYTASGATSNVLGDIQRLPNGNYLVTFSTSGQMHEISPSGALVATFTGSSFGYSEFRESLYGSPPY
jgi:Arylsulfotransferase (ASST)